MLGRLGWANGDRSPIPIKPTLDAYGPDGRWATNRGSHGDHLADALVERGAGEGTRLVVLALPRDTTDNQVEMLATLVLETLPLMTGAPGPDLTP